MPFFINFLSWGHREQDAPDKNKKRQQRRMQVRQELYLTHQIRKSPTGCRAFLLSKKLRITCIMLIVGFLKKFRPFSRENHYPPVGLKKCPTINLLSNSKNHTHSRVCNDRAIQQINKTTAVYIGALLTDALLKINLV